MGKFTITAPFELVDSEIIDALNFTPEDSANKDTDGALAANSDTKYPSQKAAKAYVDSLAATVAAALAGKQDGLITSPSAIPGGIVGVDANGDIAIARTLDMLLGFNLMPNAASVLATGRDMASGITEVYTVPAGKKAVLAGVIFNNQNAGSNSVFVNLRRGGIDLRISAITPIPTVQGFQSPLANHNFVFEAGDKICISATVNNLNVTCSIVTFDSSSLWSTHLISALSNGDNVLYTCPAGKHFRSQASLTPQISPTIVIYYLNGSGATRTYKVYMVPSGDSVRAQNQITSSTGPSLLTTTLADGGSSLFANTLALSPGDFIVINTNSGAAGQVAYVSGIEYTE